MNPPTSLSFVRNFICILTESGCSPMIALKIEELSQFLTELSVFDYYLATRRSSVTGLGAVLVSIESTELDLPTSVHQSFFIDSNQYVAWRYPPEKLINASSDSIKSNLPIMSMVWWTE